MTDREILRPLAEQAADMARDPSQAERRARYRALNRRELVKPVVLIHELPWNQLDFDGSLTPLCRDPLLRSAEISLRRQIFQWKYFQGDMVVSPRFDLPKRISISSVCPPAREVTTAFDPTNHIVSHHYEDQLRDEDSISLLKTPEVAVDEAGSERDFGLLSKAIGDILPVRQCLISHPGHFSPWDALSVARGVEPILTDLIERPEYLLDLVEAFTDRSLELLNRLESLRLIDPEPQTYCHCTAGLCDDLPGPIDAFPTRANIWGRGTAQMFSAVSPAMHREFEIEFAKRFFAGFPRVYYGCCEPLHKKISIVREIPNVTKISITPWADVDASADQMGGDFVMAWKPNPAAVAVPRLDEDDLRREIGRAISACRRNHTPMEITLKDISSANYNLQNLVRWTEIAMEMAENA